jgi:mRNA-degrading endonuclease toxin of MazEF toxin-antitoxin module
MMVLNMSKSMTISEIEHQIKNLPQADQIMMLERIVHNLKKTLVNPDITHLPKAECKLSEAPGNVFLKSVLTGLPKDSVANVSQVLTVDESFFTKKAGKVRKAEMQKIEAGLRLLLGL